jgi:hypothetical protein
MLPFLKWAEWAFVISLVMAEATASRKLVRWEDLMLATSHFPRFFGSPAEISRTDPPKVIGLWFHNDIEPLNCASGSDKEFSCKVNCTRIDCRKGQAYDQALTAISALEERQSALPHVVDGLQFLWKNMTWWFDYPAQHKLHGRQLRRFQFMQTLDGLDPTHSPIPIDNTLAVVSYVSGLIS